MQGTITNSAVTLRDRALFSLKKRAFCAWFPLKLEIAETAIHTFQGHMNEYTIKHEPSLACTKCNNSFQSEPYQYEITNVFLQFLMSIKLKNAEIEYSSSPFCSLAHHNPHLPSSGTCKPDQCCLRIHVFSVLERFWFRCSHTDHISIQ